MNEGVGQFEREAGWRIVHLLLVLVIATAFIGFFIGVDYGVPQPDFGAQQHQLADIDEHGDVIPATSYADVGRFDIGPNRNWSSDLKKLKWSAPELSDILRYAADPVAKAKAVAQRAERRAYNGAPPVIPHAINELSADNCLSCHGDGLKIAERTARVMPHPYLTNCTQCHVLQASTQFPPAVLVANTFQGTSAPVGGPRAWPGAPPQIPHTTHMRDTCIACHGPLGLDGMRSSHPWRQSCVQCHAPSAEFDQPYFDSPPPFLKALQVRNAVDNGDDADLP